LRIDKNKFIHYATDETLNNSIITAIDSDSQGTIWLGSKNGLGKIVDDRVTLVNHPELQSMNIHTIMIDSKDRLWIGTKRSGLFVYHQDQLRKYTKQEGLVSNTIRSIFEDFKGKIWVGTDRGISFLHNDEIFNLPPIENVPQGFVNYIIEDKNHQLILGTDAGLYGYQKDKFYPLLKDPLLKSYIIQTILVDNEASMWLGTYRNGITMLRRKKFLNYDTSNGLSHQVINVVFEDQHRIWAGTDNGLNLIENGQVRKFNLGSGSSINRVRDILKDSKGNLWICTYDGLIRFDQGVKRRYTQADGLLSNRIRNIVEDPNGCLWIGTVSGINKMVDGTIVKAYTKEHGLSNDFIMSLFLDESGMMWVGTNGEGVFVLDPELDHFTPVRIRESFYKDVIFEISQDAQGKTWITSNGGIVIYDGKKFHSLGFVGGQFNNSTFQILQDQTGDYWLNSDKGVIHVERSQVEEFLQGNLDKISRYNLYNRADGMNASEVTPASKSLASDQGILWISTLKGITLIDPNNIPVNQIVPPVHIEKIVLDKQEYDQEQLISIPPGKHRLEFHYTGLSYYAPRKSRFKFKLENFDQDWIDAGTQRLAVYTNIPPGDYVFKVIASNNDGIWNREGATMEITKEAFFYQTIWFYVILSLGLLSVGFIGHRIRVYQLKARNRQLAYLVKERTSNVEHQKADINIQKEKLKELNQVKDKLFSIISHDLRSPISNFETVLEMLGNSDISDQEFKELARVLGFQVRNLKDMLNNLLNWSKSQMTGIEPIPTVLNIKSVIQKNIDFLKEEARSRSIELENKINKDLYVITDLEMLKLVIRNLVNNAIKFTSPKSKVTLSAEIGDEEVIICIKDQGPGIKHEIIEKIFDIDYNYTITGKPKEIGTGLGLILCKEFVEKNGGKLWVESEYGQGSVFKFSLKRELAEQAVDLPS